MHQLRYLAAFVVLSALVIGQPSIVTPTVVFPSPGTQANSTLASFAASGIFQSPGEIAGPSVVGLAAGSLSTTICYQSYGSTTFPAPGSMSLMGNLNGTPGAPLAIGIAVSPQAGQCGGFAGWPCMTGPLLLASMPTVFGQLHLDGSLVLLLDGFGGSAPFAALNNTGNFPLAATGVIDTITNGGIEQSFAVQALIADPTAPAGATLTACLTIYQWVFYV